MASKIIYVYADWVGLPEPTLMGILRAEQVKSDEIFSFEYDKAWLKSKSSLVLDPDLQWYSGSQYLPGEKVNFGLFLDSSPDRWGRLLMQRREAVLAKKGERTRRALTASDYLLGVYDQHRMGALRFKEILEGPFLNDNREMPVPPWTSLRDLEYASLKLETDDSTDDEYIQYLNLLIAPGSSLGGARPKASVMDQDNHLWIAKFPSINDSIDTGAWEMVVHDLAIRSGIYMSDAMLQRYSGNRHTFLTKRFDRTTGNKRIHFASAMTLLGCKDGDDYHSGIGYLDIVGLIFQHGDKNQINNDLEQLWRRIVFSICVKNTDDHLRNHGFILGKQGWRLSPAFDINSIPTGTGLTLNISEDDNSLNLDLAREVAEYFRVEKKSASEIVDHVKSVVNSWRVVASKHGISRREQEIMSNAFDC
jgi:serine/threonine-protein kinase HipA